MSTVFSPAEIILPGFHSNAELMKKWAVIACDQFTSEPEYWNDVKKLTAGAESAYSYIMPEAYLGTDDEAAHGEEITAAMSSCDFASKYVVNGFIYCERTLPNGTIRHGIIGKLDLEEYDYSAGSKSAIRATEGTVLERIPPRTKVRAEASVELPHILVLTNDTTGLWNKVDTLKNTCAAAYDFELMQGGGYIKGYEFTGEALESLVLAIDEYEKSMSDVVYAMGDGNHSLAAAKAHWENLKAAGALEDHPARYALCEITDVADTSLVFEPIYRLLKNTDIADFKAYIASLSDNSAKQNITLVSGTETENIEFPSSHALTVGSVQNIIDAYIKAKPGVKCDYIHGEENVKKLASQGNTIGILFDGMEKTELFPYVSAHGVLPRKTFSMGEAESKRYYLEMRKIVK